MTLAAALAVALTTSARGAGTDYAGLHCAAYRGREVGLPAQYHTVACGRMAGGPIVGFVLRRNGTARCPITGWWDGACAVVEVCGATSLSCR